MSEEMEIRQVDVERKAIRRSFPVYARVTEGKDFLTPFHLNYYRVLDAFAHGRIRRLIVTVPPQHGKSKGSTILLPSYVLGLDPDRKIAVVSYSDKFAKRFNRAVQRVIVTPLYSAIFPDTRLFGRNVATMAAAPLRNSETFEVVDHKGFLKAVGRKGQLTGEAVDMVIMDDLYSNSIEGNSPVIRDEVGEFYSSVVKTRVHNTTQELIVFTRWHEDDLIGRIMASEEVITLNSMDDIRDGYQGWYIVNFEAIKESDPTPLDPRSMGEPLWPEKHSRELLEAKRKRDPHTFECMYQGHPSSREGLLYGDNFRTYETLPDKDKILRKANYTDTADKGEDKLCSICYEVGADGMVYVVDVLYTSEPMEITEPTTAQMLVRNGTRESHTESNNGGRGFARAVGKLAPTVRMVDFVQKGNKEARILSTSATVLQCIVMPADWRLRWPEFCRDLTLYKRLFRSNRFNDAADVLSGIIEKEVIGKDTNRIKTFGFSNN